MLLKRILNTVSMFLLIATSGIPFFWGQLPWVFIGFFLSLISFLTYTDRKLDKKFVIFVIVVFILQILQGLQDNTIYWSTYLGFIIRFIWAYLLIKCARINFMKWYVKILYFFSVIGLFFYAGMVVIPNSQAVFQRVSAPFGFFIFKPTVQNAQTFHIIIYNFHGYKYIRQSNEDLAMLRNCGPFWEPGAYVGFLMFALFFLYLSEGTIKNRKGLIFIIATITTFSTTGYLALMAALFIILRAEFNKFKWVILPVFVAVSYYAFFNLAFLNDKIETQQEFDSDKSRFGSAIRDLSFFYERPLLGYGRSADTAYGQAVSGESQTNNGITTTLAGMGGLYFLLYCGFMLYSFKKVGDFYKQKFAISYFVVFLLISFSETFLTLPFFMSLAFLYAVAQYKLSELKRPVYLQSTKYQTNTI